jgi:ribosomal protein S18 acetylase RimI-like enzyme
VGTTYRNSEYRLQLDPQAVPGERTWATPVQLRRASAEDVGLVAHLNAASFGDNVEHVQRWVARALDLESHRFFIASLVGEPIGCIRTNHDGTTMYITAFGVLPEFRGRGFGRQILLQIVDMLLREKWPTVRIEVATDNRKALDLYLSCGFKNMTTYGYYVQVLRLDERSLEVGGH